MKTTNVILPVLSEQTIGDQFNELFDYLNNQQAKVHLLHACGHDNGGTANNLHDLGQNWQAHQYLKYEQLDNIAVKLSHKYPHLQFHLHVKSGHMFPEVEILGLKVNARLVIIEPDHLAKHSDNADVIDMNHLIKQSRLTFWTVNKNGYGAFNASSVAEIHPQLAMPSRA